MTAQLASQPPGELLERSAERDLWLRREHAAEQRGFDRGRCAGFREGYAACDAGWLEALAPARAAALHSARTPTNAQLELRRWGPGGREHFADPRPGDYPGQEGAA